jgi:hypothetical protein
MVSIYDFKNNVLEFFLLIFIIFQKGFKIMHIQIYKRLKY